MSQNAELQVALKANADQLLATIKQVTGRLDQLSAKINSLPTGDKQLNKLSREFARTSITQQNLIKSFDRLGTESETTAPKLQKTSDASKTARTALSSLSLTLQDLPFGFIGIQNNLPGIIQGFGNLSSQSEGLKGATQALIGQLKGPAGLFLAFSAVTTIITFLVQKYGSLGGIIDAITGKQNKLRIDIEKSNKVFDEYIKNQQSLVQITNDASASQSGQIALIQNLTKKATDLTSSNEEQNNALKELQKISKDYYGDLKIGVQNIEAIKNATKEYTQVLISRAKIQAYIDEINTIDKLVLENDRLLKSQTSLIESERKTNNNKKRLIGTSSDISAAIVNEINVQEENIKVQSEFANKVFDLNNRKQELIDTIDKENTSIINNSKYFDDGAKSVKQYFEAYKLPKEYLDFFKFFDDETKLKRGTELFDDLGSLDLTKGTNSVTKFNEILQQLQDDFPNVFDGISVSSAKELPKAFGEVRIKLKEALDRLALQIVEDTKTSNINKAGGAVVDAFFGNTEQIRAAAKRLREETKKSISQFQPLDTSNVLGKGPGAYEKVFAPLIKMQDEMKKQASNLVNNTRDTANLLNDVFFSPLQEQFTNLLTTGKFTFKEFGKAVLDNLKQLAAKILATGIVTLLATILTGGFSAASQAKTGLTGFQVFGKAFAGALGFGRSAAGPNFSAVGAGGLAMSGAVSLSLRGSDLVGAINRTNTNINRIG
jgi:hypothetical protein